MRGAEVLHLLDSSNCHSCHTPYCSSSLGCLVFTMKVSIAGVDPIEKLLLMKQGYFKPPATMREYLEGFN
jgi:hypothetical protein